MWFAAYLTTSILFLIAGSIALISGFDTIPTIVAALPLAANMLIMRFAPRD